MSRAAQPHAARAALAQRLRKLASSMFETAVALEQVREPVLVDRAKQLVNASSMTRQWANELDAEPKKTEKNT